KVPLRLSRKVMCTAPSATASDGAHDSVGAPGGSAVRRRSASQVAPPSRGRRGDSSSPPGVAPPGAPPAGLAASGRGTGPAAARTDGVHDEKPSGVETGAAGPKLAPPSLLRASWTSFTPPVRPSAQVTYTDAPSAASEGGLAVTPAGLSETAIGAPQ